MSYDPNDPFYMPYHDLEEAKLVVSGQHEVQIEYHRLINDDPRKHYPELCHLQLCAIEMGYPTMLDHFNPF